jgi:intraflagellar transport protein 52
MSKEPNKAQPNQILFDLSKKEICDPNEYKKLLRRLKQTYSVAVSKEDITFAHIKDYQLLILGGPREPLRKEEFEDLLKYIRSGGSVIVMLGEGGEAKNGTNVNYLIEQFGISINNDSLVRTSYYKYLHPKEVFISNGILNKEMVRSARGLQKSAAKKEMEAKTKGAGKKLMDMKDDIKHDNAGLNFVYPYGSTLNVQKPAFPLLSSGPISYPMNRPLCATYVHNENKKAKLIVAGSVKMFDDEFLEKEDNAKIVVSFRYRRDVGCAVQVDTFRRSRTRRLCN